MASSRKFVDTPPDWYTGVTPWVELYDLQKVLEGVRQENLEALIDALTGAGYGVREPVDATKVASFVAAVLEYAARDGEEIELATALKWLTRTGRLIMLP